MRRRLNLLLTLIFLMLVLLCGAGAYFTDQQQASIRAAAASMGLTVSKPSYGTIPKEIEKDSRLTVQFQIRNESSVPCYLSAQQVLYVNGPEGRNVEYDSNERRAQRRLVQAETVGRQQARMRFFASMQVNVWCWTMFCPSLVQKHCRKASSR